MEQNNSKTSVVWLQQTYNQDYPKWGRQANPGPPEGSIWLKAF